MNILIIGHGGREHALGWKIQQSPRVDHIYFAPGNGGTEAIGTNVPLEPTDITGLCSFAKKNAIDLTVVGPEAPLAAGIVDRFTEERLPIFGPTKDAARLETSKAWAVEFMQRHHIPRPESHIFGHVADAEKFIHQSSWSGFVIKADGLAAGKGVVLAATKKEALDATRAMMVDGSFGEAGQLIIIQEKLEGYEVSIVAVADGTTAFPLLPAQDHKRAYDGDTGPNTGGMGAYAPLPFVSNDTLKTIKKTILQPVIDGMKQEGCPYKGALYPGLMITPDGPKVLEFNARFGDPETQPQMMLLQSDLIETLEACIKGHLRREHLMFKQGAAVCVVAAAHGYPGSYQKGVVINGLKTSTDPDVRVFHAGTIRQGKNIYTAGGRVLGITAYANDIKDARRKVYGALGDDGIHFDSMQYRTDIAHQAL